METINPTGDSLTPEVGMKEVYKYTFDPDVSLEDVEASLLLAIVSVESLHGEAQVGLDIQHLLDVEHRTCVIDATTQVGQHLNRVFMGFLNREFSKKHFQVLRMNSPASRESAGAAA
jgi:hypothetical protein